MWCTFNRLPDDIWLVDLDSNKLSPPSGMHDEIPALPEPEGTILKNHLKQVSMVDLFAAFKRPKPCKIYFIDFYYIYYISKCVYRFSTQTFLTPCFKNNTYTDFYIFFPYKNQLKCALIS